MRLVFMGTPDFSVPCLEALVAARHEVALVVTQPDRAAGRNRTLTAPPVRVAAERLGLPVFQPEKPNRPENVTRIAEVSPDALIVVAYGAILKSPLLSLARHGAINVHASLLPRYRGMSPIQQAVRDGAVETGVTTMQMDEGVDTGGMILTETTPIDPDETAGELEARLAEIGARLLVETLARIEAGTAKPVPQPAAGASYAGRITKEDGRIDWSRPAKELHDLVRAMNPWPTGQASLEGEPLQILRTRVGDPAGAAGALPGTIVATAAGTVRVACGVGTLELVEVRPAGKRAMPAAAWANGRRLAPGARFDMMTGAAR